MDKKNVYFLIFFVFLFLASCTTVKKDGMPAYDVDETKIPDATPKVEPLSKYGNLSSYKVFGKNYYVLKSSKNYEARGIASWYGTKFHAQRTSSGERYNMLGMTAAHKTLPLPTYVEVTNLSNGKKVIVKVNDRGPFESNRIIDLSYVAAKKLGMIGRGTAYVNVKAIDAIQYDKLSKQPHYLAKNTVEKNKLWNSPPHSKYAKKTNEKALVYLQVGAFKNRYHAERLKKRLLATVDSPVKITRLENNKTLYRVQIGPMKDDETARNLSKKLKSIGLMSKQSALNKIEV